MKIRELNIYKKTCGMKSPHENFPLDYNSRIMWHPKMPMHEMKKVSEIHSWHLHGPYQWLSVMHLTHHWRRVQLYIFIHRWTASGFKVMTLEFGPFVFTLNLIFRWEWKSLPPSPQTQKTKENEKGVQYEKRIPQETLSTEISRVNWTIKKN